MGLGDPEFEAMAAPSEKKRRKKKRTLSDPDLVNGGNIIASDNPEVTDGLEINYNVNEPTMGEKLESLSLLDDTTITSHKKQELSSDVKPPSADSVHILLKQALHADDRALLLDCLYTQDEKVISNSTSLLNPSDVLKLLNSLISMIQSRGAVLVCVIPWLRSLLLQHAGGITSQESSLHALNSLYQLINSRISTFGSAIQLSSSLDYLFAGISDDKEDEQSVLPPVIFEDMDSDDDDSGGDAMEADEESEEVDAGETLHDSEELDGISD
ncbi:uncharacterized protein LOC143881801 [Tasmannia lanceolata]|uniref:uncharacterized protein LOC143881801 n=1 Tax=Tasmannia lanceolata TaxID=3420 RepID=UPI004063879F